MNYYFDSNGWLTVLVNPSRSTEITPQAEAGGLKNNWTGTAWVLVPYVAPVPLVVVPVVYTKITKRGFQSRFPITADTVSTRYDLMTLFLASDSYAQSLGITGAALHGLRAMIITGTNRLDASLFVDFEAPDASRFT